MEAKVVCHPDKILRSGPFSGSRASLASQNRAGAHSLPTLDVTPVTSTAALARLKLLALLALFVKEQPNEIGHESKGEQCHPIYDCVGH